MNIEEIDKTVTKGYKGVAIFALCIIIISLWKFSKGDINPLGNFANMFSGGTGLHLLIGLFCIGLVLYFFINKNER